MRKFMQNEDIPYYDQVEIDVGVCYKSKQGNVLRIIDKVGKMFTYTCDICIKDKELFPEQKFSALKGNLKKGQTSCGCSRRPSWNEDQYKILAKRACIKYGFIFIGWAETYNGSNTHVILYDPINDCRWNTSLLSTLISKRGIKESPSGKLKRMEKQFCKQDDDMINNFYKAGFSKDYVFKRNKTKVNHKGYKDYWDYYCPICSEDEYVTNGFCSGVFTTSSYRLNNGVKCCRCVDNYQWTKEQREYQIKKICSSEDCVFIGFIDNNNWKVHSKFEWVCKNGHITSSSLSGYLHGGKRCKTCSENTNGFYQYRSDEEDILYLLYFENKDNNDNEGFIKIGRTFNELSRYYEYKAKYNIKHISTITNKHSIILQTETELKYLLSHMGFKYTPRIKFSGSLRECFTLDVLNVPEVISTFNLKDHTND